MHRQARVMLIHAFSGLLLFALSACSPDAPSTSHKASTPTATSNGTWPRTLQTAHGTLTLNAPPQLIVSTSVTLTGTLLAINAPLIASAGSRSASSVTDQYGFFTQWAPIAAERHVKVLYNGEPNVEAVAALSPDLVIVAATGGDSALKVVEQLQQIAPTAVINYDDKDWQELAKVLGALSGHEAEAAALEMKFSTQVATLRERLQLPPQPTTALVYYEDDSGANLWTPDSAQGRLLQALGFELAKIPDSVKGDTSMGKRRDIVQVSGEKFAQALSGSTLLLFSADAKTVDAVMRNRFLSHVPAVTHAQVYAMGLDTFRLDYYSATNLLQRLEKIFSSSPVGP